MGLGGITFKPKVPSGIKLGGSPLGAPLVPPPATPVEALPNFVGSQFEAPNNYQHYEDIRQAQGQLSVNDVLQRQAQQRAQVLEKWGIAQASIKRQVEEQAARLRQGKFAKKFFQNLDAANRTSGEAIDRRLQSQNGQPLPDSPALISDFQKMFGLPITGQYDPSTQQAFREATRTANFFSAQDPSAKNPYKGLSAALNNPEGYKEQRTQAAAAARQQLTAYAQALGQGNASRRVAAQTDAQTQALFRAQAGTPQALHAAEQAAKQRQQAVDIAALERVMGIKNKKQRTQAIMNLRAAAGGDDIAAITTAGKLKSGVAQNKANTNPFTGPVNELNQFFYQLAEPLYATELSKNKGQSALTQLHSGVAAFPGFGFLAGGGSAARKNAEAVNSIDEFEKLQQQGKIADFGDLLSGEAQNVLKGKYRKNALEGTIGALGEGKKGLQLPPGVRGAVGLAGNIAFQAATDPTLGISIGAHGLASPVQDVAEAALKDATEQAANQSFNVARFAGESAAAAQERASQSFIQSKVTEALAHFTDNTKVGQALLTSAYDAVDKLPKDAGSIQRALKGLPSTAADRIASAGTREEAHAAIRDAIISGEWKDAHIPLNRQLGIGVGLTDSVGRRTIAPSEGFIRSGLRKWATDTGVARAASFAHNPQDWEGTALRSALSHNEGPAGYVNTFLDRYVGSAGTSIDKRVAALAKIAQETDNTDLRAYIEQRLGGFVDKKAGYGLPGVSDSTFLATMKGIPSSPELVDALKNMEGVVAVLDGKAGTAAAEQMRAELEQGLVAAPASLKVTAGVGAKNLGTTIARVRDTFNRDSVVELIDKLPEGGLKDKATEALASLQSKKEFNQFGRQLAGILNTEGLPAEIDRLVTMESDRLAGQTADGLSRNLGRAGLKGKIGRGALSLIEPATKRSVALHPFTSENLNIHERVDAIDRAAADLGLNETQRSALRDQAAKAQTEADLFKVASQPFRLAARDAGIDPNAIDAIAEGLGAKVRQGASRAFFTDQATGEIQNGIRTAAQLTETAKVLDGAALRDALREQLMAAGEGSFGNKVRVIIDRAGDYNILGLTKNGRELTIKLGLQRAHSLWKVLVVTNLHLPAVALIAGGIGVATGTVSPQLAALGFGASLLAPLRYISRVGVEQRMRAFMDRGFMNTEWIPGIAKWQAEHDIELPFRFGDVSALRSGGYVGTGAGDRFFAAAERDWVALQPGQKGFTEAWQRVVQYQLQPDVYNVDNLLLQEVAGSMSKDEVEQALKELSKSEEGQLWMSRMAGGLNGPKNWTDAVAREREFVQTYVTNDAVAKARLSGDLNELDTALSNARPPDFIHAQRPGAILKNPWRAWKDGYGHALFDTAHGKLGAEPLARATYADNYDFLTRVMGMDKSRAADISSEISVLHTRSVMPYLDNASRFARRSDYIFPFQSIRESFFKSWGRLVMNDPLRAVRVTEWGARAFNAGADVGIFKKDPLSGDWVMTIPGSGLMSNLLGGFNAGFTVNLRDLFFLSQGGAYGVNILPTPGGPFWTLASAGLAREFPGILEKDNFISDWLLPYGPGGDLLRPESRRLWAAMTGNVAPWESLLDNPQAESEFERYKIEVARSLYARNVRNGMKPEDAWPSDEDVKSGTQHLFEVWAFMGSVAPASPHVTFPDKEQYSRIRNLLTSNGTTPFDRNKFVADHPEYAPYLLPTSTYVGPEDYQDWNTPIDFLKQASLRYRETTSYDDFKAQFKKNQEDNKAYVDRNRIYAMPAGPERTSKLTQWQADHPDLASKTRDNYFRAKDLGKILAVYPKGPERDEAINNWRLRYGVSKASYPYIKDQAKAFIPNPWSEARDTPRIVKTVTRAETHGVSEYAAVAKLPPAEQARYWDWKKQELNQNWTPYDDPRTVMNQYNAFNAAKKAVEANHPELITGIPKNQFDQVVQTMKENHSDALAAITTEIQTITAQMDAAASSKQWAEYYALKNKQQTLYDMKRAVTNDLYNKLPDLHDAYDDMAAMSVAVKSGNAQQYVALKKQLEKDQAKASMNFVPTNEELYFNSLPKNIQQSYIQTIVNRLDAPANPQPSGKQNDDYYDQASKLKGYLSKNQVSKLYWDSLSQFSQDLLAKNLSPDQVRQWSLESYVTFNQMRAKVTPVGADSFAGNPELQWAFDVLRQFDARGGVSAPSSYGEYQNLPANPQVRADFLAKHPDLQGYLEAGGFAQMNEADQMLVGNILKRYAPSSGGGTGDPNAHGYSRVGGKYYKGGSYGGNLDVAFAEEQLRLWSRRPAGAHAPDTYNLWLNMPSGQEKAQYLQDHPEIKDWLSSGPMSNMPEEYQSIVRDIMTRYGLWSQQADNPLGETITQYYSTPSYARAQFLKDHPELLAYWSALKTPQQLALQQVVDGYFAIQDPAAKKAYMASHPEVQQYLVDSRNKRYESFLNRVAFYMGQNPDMFDSYLQRQTDIMNELLRRYADTPLVRETIRTPHMGAPKGRTRGA